MNRETTRITNLDLLKEMRTQGRVRNLQGRREDLCNLQWLAEKKQPVPSFKMGGGMSTEDIYDYRSKAYYVSLMHQTVSASPLIGGEQTLPVILTSKVSTPTPFSSDKCSKEAAFLQPSINQS